MALGGPLGFSLAPYIKQSRYWTRVLTPLAKWYVNAAGYRRMGLKYDDLLLEERADVQRALKRLPPSESYDRIYRLRVASQCSVLHKDLPKDQWIKPEEDVRYLKPYVDEAIKEDQEREFWDTVQVVEKKQHH